MAGLGFSLGAGGGARLSEAAVARTLVAHGLTDAQARAAVASAASLTDGLRAIGLTVAAGTPVVAPAPGAPTLATVPLIFAGAGDSIVGGSGGYYPFLNRGAIAGGYSVTNRGRPGQYSQVVDEHFDADVIGAPIAPDVVVIECGTNDRAGSVRTIEAGSGNVGNAVFHGRAMATRALAAGLRVVVCSINHLADGQFAANTDFINVTRKADIESGMFASARAAGRIIYVDLTAAMSDPATGIALSPDLYVDSTHPSDKGSRQMSASFNAQVAAAGLIAAGDYPMTRNQSVSDATNVLGAAAGTFQGPMSDGGLVDGWAANAGDGLTLPSIVPAPAGKGSIGNAQRLTIKPGAADANVGGKYLQRQFAVTPGHRLLVMARSYGQGGFAAGTAKARLVLMTSGYTTLYPTNAVSILPAGELDGDVFHALQYLVPDGVTSLLLQLASGGNSGTADATVDFYDIKAVDLG